jgi:hypothetical protein
VTVTNTVAYYFYKMPSLFLSDEPKNKLERMSLAKPLSFVGKTKSGEPESDRCSTQVSSSLTCSFYTTSHKRPSLFILSRSDEEKKTLSSINSKTGANVTKPFTIVIYKC